VKVPVRAICRRQVAPGLALAGLVPIEADNGDQAGAALLRLSGQPDGGGVVLIERVLHDQLPAAVRRQLARAGTPVLMPFPGPEDGAGAAAAADELLDILRRSIGYRVRLR